MNKKRMTFMIFIAVVILVCFFICGYISTLKSEVVFLTNNINKLNKEFEELNLSAKELDCLRLKSEVSDLRKELKRLENKFGIQSKQTSSLKTGNRGFLLKDGKPTVRNK